MSKIERQLMRRVHGELGAESARELDRRLAADAELGSRHRRLAALWQSLELPPPAAVPEGFRARVVAVCRGPSARSASGELRWSLAPAWARVGSVAALVAGLLLGASLGGVATGSPVAADLVGDLEAATFVQPLSLAESYWLGFESSDDPSAAAGEEGGE